MAIPSFGWPTVALVCLAAALGGCTTTPQQEATPVALPAPEIPARTRASEIIGRWGYAAYHKPEDRTRTEANARGQCKQLEEGRWLSSLPHLLGNRAPARNNLKPPE